MNTWFFFEINILLCMSRHLPALLLCGYCGNILARNAFSGIGFIVCSEKVIGQFYIPYKPIVNHDPLRSVFAVLVSSSHRFAHLRFVIRIYWNNLFCLWVYFRKKAYQYISEHFVSFVCCVPSNSIFHFFKMNWKHSGSRCAFLLKDLWYSNKLVDFSNNLWYYLSVEIREFPNKLIPHERNNHTLLP